MKSLILTEIHDGGPDTPALVYFGAGTILGRTITEITGGMVIGEAKREAATVLNFGGATLRVRESIQEIDARLNS